MEREGAAEISAYAAARAIDAAVAVLGVVAWQQRHRTAAAASKAAAATNAAAAAAAYTNATAADTAEIAATAVAVSAAAAAKSHAAANAAAAQFFPNVAAAAFAAVRVAAAVFVAAAARAAAINRNYDNHSGNNVDDTDDSRRRRLEHSACRSATCAPQRARSEPIQRNRVAQRAAAASRCRHTNVDRDDQQPDRRRGTDGHRYGQFGGVRKAQSDAQSRLERRRKRPLYRRVLQCTDRLASRPFKTHIIYTLFASSLLNKIIKHIKQLC